jgi:hypothetical protein
MVDNDQRAMCVDSRKMTNDMRGGGDIVGRVKEALYPEPVPADIRGSIEEQESLLELDACHGHAYPRRLWYFRIGPCVQMHGNAAKKVVRSDHILDGVYGLCFDRQMI